MPRAGFHGGLFQPGGSRALPPMRGSPAPWLAHCNIRPMSARESIDIEGISHGVPIPNGCKIGNIVFSSAFSGKDAASGKTPEDPDEQAAVLFGNIRAFMQ